MNIKDNPIAHLGLVFIISIVYATYGVITKNPNIIMILVAIFSGYGSKVLIKNKINKYNKLWPKD